MTKNIFVTLSFHVVCLVINMHHWWHMPPLPGYTTRWAHAQFLTMWGLFGHTIYFFLSTLNDLRRAYQYVTQPSPKAKREQNTTLNTLYRAFSFPLAASVAALFWGIYLECNFRYFIDRELIYPKAWEEAVPPYMNHIQHTFPLISVLVDMVLVDHSYDPTHLRFDLFMVASVSVTYICLLVFLFYQYGIWVYPFIGMLSDTAKIGLFTSGMFLCCLFYYGGKLTSDRLWLQTKKKIVLNAKKIAYIFVVGSLWCDHLSLRMGQAKT